MDFQKLINELQGAGLSQADIARRIGVTQGRMSQVKRDSKAGFRGAATVALIALHAEKCLTPVRVAA